MIKMKNKKIHDKSIIIIFSIALFIIILFGSFNLMIFNKDFYYREYSKTGVYVQLSDNTTYAVETAHNITENVIKYFRNTEDLKYFSGDERSHMLDVKKLIRTMQFIYYGAAAITILLFFYCYRKFKEDKFDFIRILAKSLLYSSIAAIIFLLILFLLSVFSFDLTFTVFHMIFFPQGNWMFPSDSLLITLFPQQFFFDITLRIVIYAMFQALIFFGIGYWMNKQLKIHEKYNR
jgi:integral membrane protein (TIGR01906 family)